MICIRLDGGLGNQMFQYACGRALAHEHDTELIYDASSLSQKTDNTTKTVRNLNLNIFNIKAREATENDLAKLKPFFYKVANVLAIKLGFKGIVTSRYFIEQTFSYDKRIKNVADNCLLVGYWQSPLYFN